jgi:hypothetical protein
LLASQTKSYFNASSGTSACMVPVSVLTIADSIADHTHRPAHSQPNLRANGILTTTHPILLTPLPDINLQLPTVPLRRNIAFRDCCARRSRLNYRFALQLFAGNYSHAPIPILDGQEIVSAVANSR